MSPPPFRAEHIGSLLRPPALLTARQAVGEGRLSGEALRAEEDAHIRDAVRLQEEVGLDVITDGEYRRGIYFGHFGEAVSGFTEMDAEMSFRGAGGEALRYRAAVVTGRLVRHRGIATEEFRFVRALTRRTPKVTLPSPSSQHFLRWRPGVSERAYPDLDEFFADVAAIYRAELSELGALEPPTSSSTMCRSGSCAIPLTASASEAKGHDPAAMLDRYVGLVNDALAGRPPGLTVGVHVCRGNNQGKWLRGGCLRLRGRPGLRGPGRRRLLPRVRLAAGRRLRASPPRGARLGGSSSGWCRRRRPCSRTRTTFAAGSTRRRASSRSSGWR